MAKPVTLIDTAGEREAEQEVERRGVALGLARAARAEVVVWVVDATVGVAVPDSRALVVWNKTDLAAAPRRARGLGAHGRRIGRAPARCSLA